MTSEVLRTSSHAPDRPRGTKVPADEGRVMTSEPSSPLTYAPDCPRGTNVPMEKGPLTIYTRDSQVLWTECLSKKPPRNTNFLTILVFIVHTHAWEFGLVYIKTIFPVQWGGHGYTLCYYTD